MKVLVTGGAGFIGSHLAAKLIDDGDVVRVVDSLITGKAENLRPFENRIEFLQGSLSDPAVCAQAVKGVEVILHEAALPSVPRSVKNPVECHLNGAHATLLLLDAARQAGVRRVVFAASSSAYGATEMLPKQESILPQPLSPYAASKLACEFYLQSFAHCYEMDTVSLRYFNIFGPRQDPSSPYSGVLAKFCTAFVRNEPIAINGDGDQSRDFTYVDNVVSANLLAARHTGRLNGRVFNIGCGDRVTLNGVVKVLNELTGKDIQPAYGPLRAGDVRHSLADISLAREVLGYIPLVLFRDGLERTLAWYRGS